MALIAPPPSGATPAQEAAKAKEKVCDAIQLAVDEGATTFHVCNNFALTRLPESIRNMKQTIQILHIDNNYELEIIPSCIGELSQLRWLNISYNKVKELPREIGRLRNLERLHLNNNAITELPLEIWQLKQLEELHVESNALIAFPTGVLLMRKLRELFCNNNPFVTEADVDGADCYEVMPHIGTGDCANCLLHFGNGIYRVTCTFQPFCGNPMLPFVHYTCSDRCMAQLMGRLEAAAGGTMTSPQKGAPPASSGEAASQHQADRS